MDGDPTRSLVTRASITGGVVGGAVHAGVAASLWNHWFDNLGELLATKPLNGVYLVLGMFLLGFIPVLFYVGKRVVAPSVVVGGLLLLSVVGSWLANPVRAPAAVPTPFALYVLSWVFVVALAGVAGGVEYRLKRRATD